MQNFMFGSKMASGVGVVSASAPLPSAASHCVFQHGSTPSEEVLEMKTHHTTTTTSTWGLAHCSDCVTEVTR